MKDKSVPSWPNPSSTPTVCRRGHLRQRVRIEACARHCRINTAEARNLESLADYLAKKEL